MKNLKVVFLHGLESRVNENPGHKSNKVSFLKDNFSDVYAPIIDYQNPNVFYEILEHCEQFQPDIIIGSSMGGYFAHIIGAVFSIPTLMFNPALHSRSFEPNVSIYFQRVINTTNVNYVVLGLQDDIINPEVTKQFIANRMNHETYIIYENEQQGHRTPIEIFTQYVMTVVDLL